MNNYQLKNIIDLVTPSGKQTASLINDLKQIRDELGSVPIYLKILIFFITIRNPLEILVVLCGLVSFIWLCFTGNFMNNLSLFIANMFVGMILGCILGVIHVLPIWISSKLFTIKYTKWIGQLILFINSFIGSLFISIFCCGGVFPVVMEQNLHPILSILLLYFYSSMFGSVLFGVANFIPVVCFFIIIILWIIFPLTTLEAGLLLFLIMVIPLYCLDYFLTISLIEQEKVQI